LTKALNPHDPAPWRPAALRVATGFVISTAVHILFESAALGRGP
jgi:hypothetical protein